MFTTFGVLFLPYPVKQLDSNIERCSVELRDSGALQYMHLVRNNIGR